MTTPENEMTTPIEDMIGHDDYKAGIPFSGDPRDLEVTGTIQEVQIGSKTQDATVDPQPDDLLPPSNAGTADPHGPTMKAYEVGSPERNAAVEESRRSHPERHIGTSPYTDAGSPYNHLTAQ